MKNIPLTILLVFVLFSCSDEDPFKNSKVRIIAHAGYWNVDNSCQNSLSSLQNSIRLNVYGSEIDVRITKDSIVVVSHNKTVNGRLYQDTYYDDIKDLKLPNGERIPLLSDLLEAIREETIRLVIEVKQYDELETELLAAEKTVEIVNLLGLQAKVDYISWSFEICKKIAELNPTANIAYLSSLEKADMLITDYGYKSPSELKRYGINGLDYTLDLLMRHPECIQEAHNLGMTVNCFTLNSEIDIINALYMDVDFITTDNPVLCNTILKR